jgi:hypothetical protein
MTKTSDYPDSLAGSDNQSSLEGVHEKHEEHENRPITRLDSSVIRFLNSENKENQQIVE